MILGDLNSRIGQECDFVQDDNTFLSQLDILPDDYNIDSFLSRQSQDYVTNANGALLIDFLKQSGLRVANGRVCKDRESGSFTYISHNGSSLIDYCIVEKEILPYFESFCVLGPNILSDHCTVQFSFTKQTTFDIRPINSNNGKNSDTSNHNGYKWNSCHKEQYQEDANGDDFKTIITDLLLDVDTVLTPENLDTVLLKFNSCLDDLCKPYFEKRVYKDNNSTCMLNTNRYKSQFNEICNNERVDFYNKLNEFRKHPNDSNKLNMVHARSVYKKSVRKFNYEKDRLETNKLLRARYQNSKLYWKLLKSSSQQTRNKTNLSVDSFAQYFQTINNPSDPFFQPDEDILYFNERILDPELKIMFSELDAEITLEELQECITELKTGKAGGADYFLNEFIIHGGPHIHNFILKLFNKIFEIGYFPNSWSDGIIIPIHKSGSINEVQNYRGITLLSVIGKLFTKIINNRLTTWAEDYYIIVEAQAGFRAKMGTSDNIFVLHGLISHFINSNKPLYCTFIDFSKAFDYVVRENIWYKLVKLGIRGKMLEVIKSIYETVKAHVKYDNSTSDSFDCYLGIRQGDSLSPFIFSMYINDLEDELFKNGFEGIDIGMLKLYLLMYADDIVIFSNTATDLQNGLNILGKYCKRWKLKVNTKKTKVMIFRKGGALSKTLEFYFENTKLEIVNKYTYLGIVFTSGGSFSEAQKTLAGQAQKAIFKLRKYLYRFTNIDIAHQLDLFDKLIYPILSYSSEVWGFCCANKIERTHLQFCKSILNVKSTAQNDFIYGELGRLNIRSSNIYRIVKYWFKILSSPNRKYISLIYKLMIRDLEHSPNKKNWASLLRNTLDNLGFSDVWLAQGVGNVNSFLIILKQRVKDVFIQNWNERLTNSSRANFYCVISNFNMNNYLSSININKYRVSLTRLRVSSHRLMIETGRWNNTPKENRKCLLCDSIEDEYHFIFKCELYDDLRQKYIKPYYYKHPNIYKAYELFNSTSKTIIRNLSVFIHKSFEKRKEFMQVRH